MKPWKSKFEDGKETQWIYDYQKDDYKTVAKVK